MECEFKPLPVAGNMVALSTNVSYVNNPVCLTMTAVPFILLPPQPHVNLAAPCSPPSPRFLLSLFMFAMLAKSFAALHGSQIRPSKVTMRDQDRLWPVS